MYMENNGDLNINGILVKYIKLAISYLLVLVVELLLILAQGVLILVYLLCIDKTFFYLY